MGRGKTDLVPSTVSRRLQKPYHQSKSYKQAREVAAKIITQEPKVQAVLLYGSVISNKTHPQSDIDLIVLSQEKLSKLDLKQLVPELDDKTFNLTLHNPHSIQRSLMYDWSFMACLADTAQVIAGDENALHMVTFPKPPTSITFSQLDDFLLNIESLKAIFEFELDDQNGRWFEHTAYKTLFDLYRTTRQALVLAAAERGEKAWSRKEAFRATQKAYPELRSKLRRIASLEPYWQAYHRELEALSLPSSDEILACLSAAEEVVQFLVEEVQDK